ncbi:MAG: mechanosensitive ion channel family protein [Alphaproteobacteria bacterium]
MDALEPYKEWILRGSDSTFRWINYRVLTMEMAVQASLIAGLLVAAKVCSIGSGRWLENKLRNRNLGLVRIHATYQEIFFLLYMVIFSWFTIAVVQVIALPTQFLEIFASLATAWAVIRFTSSTIESPFWARLVALVLWVVAALNIMGWLRPTISIMQDVSFEVGDVSLSLYMVAKAILAFALLMWVVRMASGMMQRGYNRARGLTPSQKVLFFKLSNIALYIIGGMIALNIVGIDVTALAVFSGALGFGIGFGLQKVFSNLISGIILLLDKSVKPGDVIAINDTYGWVNKLGARCVSVLTRDGKEHLIPNEVLITEQVENWSYSSEMIRVHIELGVSYHADMHKVRELLFESVKEHPRILTNPKPNVLMTGFGDNAVNFEIRCWIADPVEGISNLKSDVYFRVWDLFREHSIEIPFPQRDVHLNLQPSEALDTLNKALGKKQAS